LHAAAGKAQPHSKLAEAAHARHQIAGFVVTALGFIAIVALHIARRAHAANRPSNVFHVVRTSAALLFRGASGAALEAGLRLTFLSFVALLGAGCSLASDYEPEQVTSEALPADADPAPDLGACVAGQPCCTRDDDCASGETCAGGVCQVLTCELDVAGMCEPCVGADCAQPDQLAPTCSDEILNGDESDVDCGGSCPERCAANQDCVDDTDCASRCVDGSCAAPSCDDEIANQDESDVDCGGSCPERCAANQDCRSGADCASDLICSSDDVCTPASCDDQQLNGSETDLDCGGDTCPGCPDGGDCTVGGDCASRVCSDGTCAEPSCDDGTLNQDETAADCGGSCEAACDDGDACVVADDCASGVCGAQGCDEGATRCCQAPTCTDELLNGSESDVDCGGVCPDCPDGDTCRVGFNCESGTCDNGVCVSCEDGDENGSETDEDCGGPNTCDRCAPGLECVSDADCASNACQDGRCCGGNLGDCTRCAERLSPNLSCATGPINADPLCSQFLECLRANADVCTTRSAPGCSGEGNVCNHNTFGGDANIPLTFVTQILAEAGCTP
jgi:hypothetical protein